MTMETKLNDAREEGEGRLIALLLSDGKTPEEVAEMFKMTVDEVHRLEKMYLASVINF